ncbi:DNA (cytosine-5-)-methyltransferase [Enterococcus casseliflavus]|uniref:Cytosine-specific methyltransferase n=1 Tax=Vagococcus entomophilus TaxID=1160095 RepID=A0A430AF23_9ENTE|nr:DNA (cytosine-5-)-methyltransferase [Vagococcus entomophilus]RSU06209.1 DNA (cytosine-5-)-methyltransferase [Vagococcus entomophilus]
MNNSNIRVAEMFAGVGGFHLGLKNASPNFEIIWANQFEPSRKNQFAFKIYQERFPEIEPSNEDFSKIDKTCIPDMDLLVGGFPCQDYSVAASGAKGIVGKKGVLWWDIRKTIEVKKPKYIFLENVDRLLSSPGVTTVQPGRDFGIMLRTLSDLGYGVTWKMINASDYGFPQKRRRTFIFAFRKDSIFMKNMKNINLENEDEIRNFLTNMSPLSSTLANKEIHDFEEISLMNQLELKDFSDNFRIKRGFRKTGFMIDGHVYMANYQPVMRPKCTLRTIIKPNIEDDSLYLSKEQKNKFAELKAGFRKIKISKTGHPYKYGMGAIAYPDSLDEPARTMVTSEHTISRMSHVVRDPGNNKKRLISPEEAELINMFPEGWTKIEGITKTNRYFTMGNALVVGLVTEIGEEIEKLFKLESDNIE